MSRQIVLVGGGHAHMVTLANLHVFIEKGHRVTVIQPSDYHYYSGMGPGMLGMTYTPDDIRFATRRVVEKKGGRFIKGSVSHINPESQTVFLASGESVSYDVVSFNAGSYVPQQIVSNGDENIFSVKPIERLIEAQSRLLELMTEKQVTAAVIGGGAAAAEIAGNIWQLAKMKRTHPPQVIVFAGRRFMTRFTESIRNKAIRSLTSRGIQVLEQSRVQEVKSGFVTLETGKTYPADIIFLAVGVIPSSIFKQSGLPVGPDGGLLVNSYLQSSAYPNIFGGGDCIYFKDQPLDKVGVYAVRENPVLYHNVMAALDGLPLRPFHPGGDYLLIFNMGNHTGILKKKWIEFDGRLAFKIKDYIDRRFMKRFQAIESE